MNEKKINFLLNKLNSTFFNSLEELKEKLGSVDEIIEKLENTDELLKENIDELIRKYGNINELKEKLETTNENTNKTTFYDVLLELIYQNTLNELIEEYGDKIIDTYGYEYKYELIFDLLKTPIFINFIDKLFEDYNYNITTDDIKEHLDLKPTYITSKLNEYINYTRYPEGAFLYFEKQENLSLVQKEKLKRKIVFYNQDSYRTFLKENIYLVNETKEINIDIDKLIIDNDLLNNIDIDSLILSEIKSIEKDYYKNFDIKKNISNIDDETINKILDKEMNLLTTSTVKNFVKNDIVLRQKDKLLNILNYKLKKERITEIRYNYELKEINENYTLNTNNEVHEYKNIYNEAYEEQVNRFLHSRPYKEYNLYLNTNSSPIRLFYFINPLNFEESIIEGKYINKYSIDKAAYYENIEYDILKNIQAKIDKNKIKTKKEIATNIRAKEEIKLKKALSDKNLQKDILNINKNNQYYDYIIHVINNLSEE